MTALTHCVLRRLETAAGDIPAGKHVDASAWENLRTLESEGYVRPLTPDEQAAGPIPEDEPEASASEAVDQVEAEAALEPPSEPAPASAPAVKPPKPPKKAPVPKAGKKAAAPTPPKKATKKQRGG